MDPAAWKKLLEHQARERAELKQRLDETRPDRAMADALREANRPVPRPSWALKPTAQSFYPKHLKNWEAKDGQELDQLDQKHAADRAQAQGPVQGFNPKEHRQTAREQAREAARRPVSSNEDEREP